MKKIIVLFLFIVLPFFPKAQMWGFFPPVENIFDNISSNNISFIYSFRKIQTSYHGYCVRARRTDNNAQVDVLFDNNGNLSNSSICTVAIVGTSAYTIGQQMTWSSFNIGISDVRATIWYDQSSNSRNAIQNSNTAQPQIIGFQNGLFYLKYTGVENLYCPYASNVLLAANGSTQGVNGTFFIVTTPSVGVNPMSFGYLSGTSGVRWSAHIDWSDGNVYFDAGEVCCTVGTRSFPNSSNNNIWKQYTLQRLNTNKLVKISGTIKMNGAGSADAYDATNTSFGIGNVNQNTTTGHTGNIGECILLNSISPSQLERIEKNQVRAWYAY
jgi:hypothetical protein